MTATPAEAQAAEEKTTAAVNQAVVELLVSPEYGLDFIAELQDAQQSRAADEAVADRVDAILRELAKPYIEALPEATREHYKKFLPGA